MQCVAAPNEYHKREALQGAKHLGQLLGKEASAHDTQGGIDSFLQSSEIHGLLWCAQHQAQTFCLPKIGSLKAVSACEFGPGPESHQKPLLEP